MAVQPHLRHDGQQGHDMTCSNLSFTYVADVGIIPSSENQCIDFQINGKYYFTVY